MAMIRVLGLADTHLGFDFPLRPRVVRRRRGFDFFRNYERALAPALRGEVDVVIHGGDIMYRSRVPRHLVDMAFVPLRKIADKGIPVYIVPGNHERSVIPYRILAAHPNIFIFDRPVSFSLKVRGYDCVLAGFPFIRRGIRKIFLDILDKTGWCKTTGDVYILCMHQSVDGCTTGPKNFMFARSRDVIDVHEIPSKFSCVLSGHMHRAQVITTDLCGKSLSTPVLYPGSVERTSFAERNERKGHLVVHIPVRDIGHPVEWRFMELPTRPMVIVDCDASACGSDLESWLRLKLRTLPDDSIVKVRIHGIPPDRIAKTIPAETLRAMARTTMNISVAVPGQGHKNVRPADLNDR